MDDEPLPFPLAAWPGFFFGAERGRFLRGAIIANVATSTAIYLLGILVGAIIAKVSPSSVLDSSGNLDRSLTAGFWPSGAFTVGCIFLDGTLSSASTLAIITETPAVDYPIIVVTAIIQFSLVIYLCRRTSKFLFAGSNIRFARAYVVVKKDVPGWLDTCVKSAAAKFVWFGDYCWMPVSLLPNANLPKEGRALRFFYWSQRARRPNEHKTLGAFAPMFFFVDWFITAAIAIARGIRIDCKPILWLIMALNLFACVLVFYLQPARIQIKNVLAVFSAIVTAVASALVAVSQKDKADAALNKIDDSADESLRRTGEILAISAALLVIIPVPFSLSRYAISRCLNVKFEASPDHRDDEELGDMMATEAAPDRMDYDDDDDLEAVLAASAEPFPPTSRGATATAATTDNKAKTVNNKSGAAARAASKAPPAKPTGTAKPTAKPAAPAAAADDGGIVDEDLDEFLAELAKQSSGAVAPDEEVTL